MATLLRATPHVHAFAQRAQAQRDSHQYAREALRAKVAEQYKIPRSEAHTRVLEDLEHRVEGVSDPASSTTDFRAHIHAVQEARTRTYHPGNEFAWNHYIPAVSYAPQVKYVLSAAPTVTYIPQANYDYQTWTTTLTNTTINPVWTNWVASSTASATYTYRITDQNWANWNPAPYDYDKAIKQYRKWWAEGDANFNVARDARGQLIVPEGQVYDDRTGDIIDIEVWEERQVARELAATRLNEARLARLAADAAKRDMADKRAVELLMSVLDSRQQKQYLDTGSILVVTPKGRHVQLNNGWGGNAVEKCARTGRPLKRFCIHPANAMPDADNVLLQKLLLETDEDKFFRVAYTTDLERRGLVGAR